MDIINSRWKQPEHGEMSQEGQAWGLPGGGIRCHAWRWMFGRGGKRRTLCWLGALFFFCFFFALGVPCCAQASSSCSEPGLLSSCDVRVSHCSGFSCCRAWAPVVAAHGYSCLWACEIFLSQGSNPCPLALAGGALFYPPPSIATTSVCSSVKWDLS